MKKREQKDYSYKTLLEERGHGVFWYSWLWQSIRPILIAVCVLLVVSGIVIKGFDLVNSSFFVPVNEEDTAEVVFVVENGSSLTRVSNNLQKQNLIRNRSVFKYYSDFLGYGQKIQAGEYILKRSMSMREIAEKLTTGDGKPITREITVIPGWTIEDIAKKLAAEGAVPNADIILALCKTGEQFDEYYYIADIIARGDVAERKYVLEGYLAPDTYEVYTSATPEEIVSKLLSQTEAVYTASCHERAEQLGYTMDEIITLASMIEKEAKTADFARVSAVFQNRLQKGMSLGSDVTVKYATGTKRMNLNKDDLAFKSPYNTYLFKGLPVGPICNPGENAINAALYPDEGFISGKYLYFCSKDPETGELYFSKTIEEHNMAVEIYSPLWKAYDEKTGAQ